MSAINYLLHTKTAAQLQLNMDEQTFAECKSHLLDPAHWQDFQDNIDQAIIQARHDLENSPAQEEDQLKPQLEHAFNRLKRLESREKAIHEINLFLHDAARQKKLVIQDEIVEYFPEYVAIQNKIEQINHQKNELNKQRDMLFHDNQTAASKLTNDVIELELEKNELEKKLIQISQQNSALTELLSTIASLKKPILATTSEHAEHGNIDVIENVADINSSADEIAVSAQVYKLRLNELDASYELAGDVTPASGIMHAIPLASEFVRGLNYLREAYRAYQDKESGQRKTKFAAGIFGGLVSLGSLIVSALLLGGVGLLATASAVTITPIVLAAAAMGVCAVTLYRDSYILRQSAQQAHVIENKLAEIAHEIKSTEESVKLQYQDVPDAGLKEKMQHNPRLVRLGMEQAQLTVTLEKLNSARNHTRRNMRFSVTSLVGLGLALTAICLTGVGALVASVIAATTLIGVASVRIRDARLKRRETFLRQKKSTGKIASPIHTSELTIEKELLHSKKRDIEQALIQQTVSLEKTVTKTTVTSEKKATVTPEKTLSKEPNEREGEGETETDKKPRNLF